MPKAGEGNNYSDYGENGGADIRNFVGKFAETGESFRRLSGHHCCNRSNAHQCQCQAETERQHQCEAQYELLQLQAEQEHGKRRGTRHKSTGEAEEDDLPCRHVSIREAPLQIKRVCLLMFVLESRAVRMRMVVTARVVVVMSFLRELHLVGVGNAVVIQRKSHAELVWLRNVRRRLKEIFACCEREDLPPSIGPNDFDGCNLIRRWCNERLLVRREIEPEVRQNIRLEDNDFNEAAARVYPRPAMWTTLVMVMIPRIGLLSPRAPKHPRRHADDDDEIGRAHV